ncbi:hypothetical protein QWZ10_14350 [Paracoccus cavernae]|uniref:Uncharacterized protein n=1 Tax=Paracoccus cavernae TaxID=1571207 RepID=A0ABT8D7Y5_9RHOB|nr:hypothetical protein [Paracoccus cavernae]
MRGGFWAALALCATAWAATAQDTTYPNFGDPKARRAESRLSPCSGRTGRGGAFA